MFMRIRKGRSHKCGHSNIDYRTKDDQEAIKTYMPWRTKKDFGTMGYEYYKLPYTESKKMLKVTESLNNQKTIMHEIPDPKCYSTAQFYKTNNIPFKEKALFACDRIAQLDEYFKGKERFVGDSMMISDLNKKREMLKQINQIQKHKEKDNENEDKSSEEAKNLKCKRFISFTKNFYFN